jgi:hypothetical protein
MIQLHRYEKSQIGLALIHFFKVQNVFNIFIYKIKDLNSVNDYALP